MPPTIRLPDLTGVTRRTAHLLGVALVLARAGASHRGVPPPAALIGLQRSSDRAHGLPALVAEMLAGYTEDPLLRGSPGVASERILGGRVATPGNARGSVWRSRPEVDPALEVDQLLVPSLLIRSPRMGGGRLAFGQAVLDGLAVDARRSQDPAEMAAAAGAVAHASATAPVTLEADRDTGDVLELRSVGNLDAPVIDQVAAMLVGSGIVHGRLGPQLGSRSVAGEISHWELARRVSPACRSFLLTLVAEARRDEPDLAQLAIAGRTIGLPERSLADNVHALAALLVPVARAWPSPGGIEPGHRVDHDPLLVRDELGLLYGLADLLAVRRTLPPSA